MLAKAQKWFRDRGSSGGFQRQPLHRAPYPRAPYCPGQPKIRLWNQRKGRKKQVIKSLQIQIYCVTVRQPKCQTKDKSKSSSGKTSFTIYPAWNYVWLTDKLNKLEKFPEFPRCFQLHFDSRSYSKLTENLSSTVICMRSTNLILCLPFTLNKICTTKSFHIKVIH